jgi:hypothetical protein
LNVLRDSTTVLAVKVRAPKCRGIVLVSAVTDNGLNVSVSPGYGIKLRS